jgi:hypothetical protein
MTISRSRQASAECRPFLNRIPPIVSHELFEAFDVCEAVVTSVIRVKFPVAGLNFPAAGLNFQ